MVIHHVKPRKIHYPCFATDASNDECANFIVFKCYGLLEKLKRSYPQKVEGYGKQLEDFK